MDHLWRQSYRGDSQIHPSQDSKSTMYPAEVLNTQFQSVFGDDRAYTGEELMLKTRMTNSDLPLFDDIKFKGQRLRKLLKNLI